TRVLLKRIPPSSCPIIDFFFQAEDGIRDGHVTGVQTCALPICELLHHRARGGRGDALLLRKRGDGHVASVLAELVDLSQVVLNRSEERRVGKECRSRRLTDDNIKKYKKDRLNV